MEDQELLRLYYARKEQAISQTETKYGSYCRTIAWNILKNREDTAECVNDTWLSAWNHLPPDRPHSLRIYLGKLTRSISLDRWRYHHAEKRGSQLELALEELSDSIPDSRELPEELVMRLDLSRSLKNFLSGLQEKERQIFLLRYWYFLPVAEIAEKTGMTRGGVSAALTRTRQKLKRYLTEQEGL